MKIKVGLFFGGKSTEHEVSVVTAIQLYENMDSSKFEVIPIYISKDGDFYTGVKLLNLKSYGDVKGLLLSSTKITFAKKQGKGGLQNLGVFPKFSPLDVAIVAIHGSFGEDGCLQGLLETYGIPYTGFNVTGSAISMDKVLSKALFHELGLPTCKYYLVNRTDWNTNSKKIITQIKKVLKFPLFVKPATIGSSIGVNKAKDDDSLSFGIEVAATYAEKILIEEAFENCVEVNCSALGYLDNVRASVCEMPIPSSEILSFMDKYSEGMSKGTKGSKGGVKGMASLARKIPAPIPDDLTKKIQETTIKIFNAMDGCGVARVDYFVDPKSKNFWVNELNSIPGSFSFYLWEPTGVPYMELIDLIVSFALKRAENQSKTKYVFESGLLSEIAKS